MASGKSDTIVAKQNQIISVVLASKVISIGSLISTAGLQNWYYSTFTRVIDISLRVGI